MMLGHLACDAGRKSARAVSRRKAALEQKSRGPRLKHKFRVGRFAMGFCGAATPIADSTLG